jgi:predicted TIM-barrel fold metal-dependent hydrolase
VIDCDVHNTWKSAEVLLPYLEPYFRDYLARGELGPKVLPVAHRAWLHPEGYTRADAVPPDGAFAGSDYELMREQLLDRFDVEYAILTGDDIMEVSTIANPHYASALARAHNDWLIDTWLAWDSRLKGSMIVAPQDPHGAAAEIRRVGSHPDIVQVLLSSGSQRPYGDPFYLPIWEAAVEVGLPVAAHFGGTAGVNQNPTGCGPPTYYIEFHTLCMETGMGHVASLICQGVFERFPTARFVLVELGTAWLPALLWRLDADYKALRKETPWLKRLPSEYAWEHIRMTTQPLEDPENVEQLWNVLDAMHGKDVLMYSSDYPHWDFDDPTGIRLPPDWGDAVFDGNARKLYGFPSRDTKSVPVAAAGAAGVSGHRGEPA